MAQVDLHITSGGKYFMIEINEAVNRLAPLLQQEKLIAFVGSGVSRRSLLPDWDGFLKEFAKFCAIALEQDDDPTIQALVKDALDAGAHHNPIHLATVLKQTLVEREKQDSLTFDITSGLQEWFAKTFLNAKPNELHNLIVRTNFPFLLTTNYDRLLEEAARECGINELYLRAFSFVEDHRKKLAAAVYNRSPCVIHIHGLATGIVLENVILTAEDYIKIIKRRHHGFTFIIQQLLFNYHTLFLGYGASDPHLEDLIEELAFFRNFPDDHARLPKSFLVVKREKARPIFEKYKKKMGTELIVIDDYEQYQDFLKMLNAAAPRKVREQ